MHGGGWYTGDKTNFDDLNVINIFIEYGFVVVNMNYRLAPAYKYPAPLDDIDSVIAMITAKSKLYNANTNQIFLLGKSAGGHIALQYAYSRKNERVKAAVDFLGLSDLAARDEFAVRLDTQIADFIGTPYSVAPDIWQQASPIFHMKDAIPTCIVHGTADDVVFPVQSERLNDSLELYGVPHKYITWDGYNHVLSIPVWQTSTDIVCKWLEKYKKE
jgi:acetyl esterase/lipase